METNFLEIIRTRRSYRAYKPEQITDKQLNAVLEAGTYAPTSRGLQSPFIVAVQNEDLKLRLAKMNAEIMGVTTNPYYDAPTYVLVFVPADAPNGIQDASLVLENMMLAAHAQGLGSCWIHREREMFATEEGKELMKQCGLPVIFFSFIIKDLRFREKQKQPVPRNDFLRRAVRKTTRGTTQIAPAYYRYHSLDANTP